MMKQVTISVVICTYNGAKFVAEQLDSVLRQTRPADEIIIQYGGSMKAENAAGLLAKPDVDGGLIGGAALKVETFEPICKTY